MARTNEPESGSIHQQQVSNPLLAAFAVPPPLPRLVDSKINAQLKEKEKDEERRVNILPLQLPRLPGADDDNAQQHVSVAHDAVCVAVDDADCESDADWLDLLNLKLQVSALLQQRRYDPSILLSNIRREFEHRIPSTFGGPSGTNARYLEPTFVSKVYNGSNAKGTARTRVQFFCMPFFHLKHLAPTPTRPPTDSPIHPTRTMLQTQDPSTSAKRELQQEFIAHLASMDGDCGDSYDVFFKHSMLGPKDWANVIKTAGNEVVRLKLRARDQWQRRRPQMMSRTRLEPSYESGLSGSEAEGPKPEWATDEKKSDSVQKAGQKTDPLSHQTWTSGDVNVMNVARGTFHLYYWLSVSPQGSDTSKKKSPDHPSTEPVPEPEPETTTFSVDVKILQKSLSDLTTHIEQSREPAPTDDSYTLQNRGLPVKCPPRTLQDVESKLQEIKDTCTTTSSSVSTAQRPPGDPNFVRPDRYSDDDSDGLEDPSASAQSNIHPDQIRLKHSRRIVRLAKHTYKFLLPLDGKDLAGEIPVMTGLFWGMVYWYLENPSAEGTARVLSCATRHFLIERLTTLSSSLLHGPHPRRLSLHLPSELQQLPQQLLDLFLWDGAEHARG
ncbi:MAG: hypothetical protein Q9168_005964 [Polycauliona sp. 1 TL-2023]